MDCLKRFGDTIGSNGNFFHQWAKLEWNMIFKIAVRYVTFMLLISICSWISVMTKSTNKSKDSAEIPYKFLGFHATVTANVALYRLYFTFFGVLSNAAKKFQMKKSIKSKYENVESVDDKVTN
ncbi:uncharacterized protein LOC118434991 isoform X2 [Folsomia candida]|uniref:uncharacterized protein LOC118434991 isoform X2 n=1 Tax=Folsomia candida TaxID=158441 RepID=UPI00160558DA|nr:uncharacterized protein LOC118434991 isoform X2 [Folsomia candida]